MITTKTTQEALLSQETARCFMSVVVSCDSTKRRAQSFTLSYTGYSFITAYN